MSTADKIIALVVVLVVALVGFGWMALSEMVKIRVAICQQGVAFNDGAEKRAAWFLEQLEAQVNLLRCLVQRAEETLHQRQLRELDEQYAAGQIDGYSHWERSAFLIEQKAKQDAMGRQQSPNKPDTSSADGTGRGLATDTQNAK